jgi:glycosyltransferase involved in cell wall biosynthesis
MGVGRLIGTKGFDLLIRAFARVRQVVDCRLIILGEGKERRSLLALAGEVGVAESVDLPGHVANPYAWISRARLFVLASRWEGSPNVVIEALGLGVPVVSTDCPGGVRELLQDGRCGTLVALDDEAMLAQAIQEGLLAKVDKQALVNSVRKFDAAISAQTYLEALRVNPL